MAALPSLRDPGQQVHHPADDKLETAPAGASAQGLSYVPYLVEDLARGFPRTDLVDAAAALVHRAPLPLPPVGEVERFQHRMGSRAVLEVRPGAVVLRGRQRVGKAAATSTRSVVTSWTRRSRSRMTLKLASLDYAPLFELGTPAMVTLTLPGDWLTVAPTGRAFKQLVDRFFRRLERAYGREAARLVWKLEFQLRGAPHLHAFMVPPTVLARCSCCRRELPFRQWLSHTWADVVGHPDAGERAKHLAAGTGVDYREGLRARDPKRLAVYFSKHGGAAGGKEYQHEVPAEWLPDGCGRFWGVRGLETVTAAVPVTDDAAKVVKRTLRRLSQRQAFYGDPGSRWPTKVEPRTHRVRVPRGADTTTGELRYRSVRRRRQFLANTTGGGFLLVNDGPALASALARLEGVSP